LVKEGDKVKKGDRLLLQENIQASADVQAQAASINSAEAGVEAAEASHRAAQADLLLQQANLEKAKLDWERGQGLFKDGLIPKQDFDQRKTGYDAAAAQVDSSRRACFLLKPPWVRCDLRSCRGAQCWCTRRIFCTRLSTLRRLMGS